VEGITALRGVDRAIQLHRYSLGWIVSARGEIYNRISLGIPPNGVLIPHSQLYAQSAQHFPVVRFLRPGLSATKLSDAIVGSFLIFVVIPHKSVGQCVPRGIIGAVGSTSTGERYWARIERASVLVFAIASYRRPCLQSVRSVNPGEIVGRSDVC